MHIACRSIPNTHAAKQASSLSKATKRAQKQGMLLRRIHLGASTHKRTLCAALVPSPKPLRLECTLALTKPQVLNPSRTSCAAPRAEQAQMTWRTTSGLCEGFITTLMHTCTHQTPSLEPFPYLLRSTPSRAGSDDLAHDQRLVRGLHHHLDAVVLRARMQASLKAQWLVSNSSKTSHRSRSKSVGCRVCTRCHFLCLCASSS